MNTFPCDGNCNINLDVIYLGIELPVPKSGAAHCYWAPCMCESSANLYQYSFFFHSKVSEMLASSSAVS